MELTSSQETFLLKDFQNMFPMYSLFNVPTPEAAGTPNVLIFKFYSPYSPSMI